MSPGSLPASFPSRSTHDLLLRGALDLGRRLGSKLSGDDDLFLLTVEVEAVLAELKE